MHDRLRLELRTGDAAGDADSAAAAGEAGVPLGLLLADPGCLLLVPSREGRGILLMEARGVGLAGEVCCGLLLGGF
jgi:hypothetical protein